MSQFTSGFWDLYIGIITVVSILACAVLLWQQSVQQGVRASVGNLRPRLGRGHQGVQQSAAALVDVDVLPDDRLGHRLPGAVSGPRQLPGHARLDPGRASCRRRTQQAQKAYGPLFDKFAAQDVETLAKNPEALAIGQKLFLNNCAQCHASDGGGSRGFPNLTDVDWLWGGTPEAIKTSIAEGRLGVMPPWAPVLGEQGVKDVANYVRSLSGLTHDSIRAARGKEKFAQICVACHGADGKGNPAIGAPNLTDKIWLHGGSEEQIIADHRQGTRQPDAGPQGPAHPGEDPPADGVRLLAFRWSAHAACKVAPGRKAWLNLPTAS